MEPIPLLFSVGDADVLVKLEEDIARGGKANYLLCGWVSLE